MVLETRYPLFYGIAIYRDVSTNDVYAIKVYDAKMAAGSLEAFLDKARKLT
jgi:hypothetical protein